MHAIVLEVGTVRCVHLVQAHVCHPAAGVGQYGLGHVQGAPHALPEGPLRARLARPELQSRRHEPCATSKHLLAQRRQMRQKIRGHLKLPGSVALMSVGQHLVNTLRLLQDPRGMRALQALRWQQLRFISSSFYKQHHNKKRAMARCNQAVQLDQELPGPQHSKAAMGTRCGRVQPHQAR